MADGRRTTRVLVLGTTHVVAGGQHRDLGSTQRAAMLARLAISRGRPVSVDQLAEDVWGSRAEDAVGSLRVAICRLRALIGKEAIVSRNDGYALDLDLVDLDLVRFERLVAPARGDDAARRLDALDEAAALIRGPVFAGLHHYPFVGAEVAHIEALRDRAADERFGLLLDAGAAAELIGELETALHDRPLNEFRCGALMTALYRAGRQADALGVLQRTSDRLRDEKGLSPSPQLRAIEHQVLKQDPALLGPPSTAALGTDAVGEIEAMLSSANALGRAGAWAPALRFASRAVADARLLGEPTLTCRCLLTMAQVGFMSGEHDPNADPSAFWAALDEAAAIARRRRDGPLMARAAITRFLCGIGPSDDRQLVSLTEPLDHLPRKAIERADLLGAAAALVLLTDGGTTADRLREQIDGLAEEVDDPRVELVRSTIACVAGSRRAMPVAELVQRSHDALDLAAGLDDDVLLMVALHARLMAVLLAGDLDELERLGPDIERAGRTSLVPFAVQRSRLLRHALALTRGDLDGVIPEILETAEIGRRIGAAATDAPMAQLIYSQLELAEYRTVIELLPTGGDDPSGLVDIVRTLALAELRDDPDDAEVAAETASLLRRLPVTPSPEVSPAAAALAAELAWWVGSPPLAAWALDVLDRERCRMVAVGPGTLILGPAELYAGLGRHVVGQPDKGIELLESALARLDKVNADLLAARARIYLATSYRLRDQGSDSRRADALDAAIRPDVPRLAVLARRAERWLAA